MAQERTFRIDVAAEINRYFDDSSLSPGARPKVAIITGAPAVGKTTFRQQRYSSGYVLVDAAQIFLNLTPGVVIPFPDAFEPAMELIGRQVVRRAIAERRHIVTEICIVAEPGDSLNELVAAMQEIGYEAVVQMLTCDPETAVQRNLTRGDFNISSYYAQPYHRKWLMEAAAAAKGVT
jgi:hypothetical protein